MKDAQLRFNELKWKNIRERVNEVNPVLSAIIDELDPPFKLFKAIYRFGDEILKKGYLQLPQENGHLISITDGGLNNRIKEQLSYNQGSNPAAIILKNTAEIFTKLENRIIPLYGLIQPGKFFGLWRVLNPNISYNPTFLWEMTAGARSLIMLPKIAKASSHKKLQQTLNLRTEIPRSLIDHWQVFKEIAQNDTSKEPWETEILFFSYDWFKQFKDPAWRKFHAYLLEIAWEGSEFWRNQFIWDMVFSYIREKKHLKADPYLIDIVKHLLAIGVGAVPGFAPANDDNGGPLNRIQSIFSELYNLHYAPIIMQPHFFSMAALSRPVYYSLQYPTSIEFSPKSSTLSTKIADLYALSRILHKFLAAIEKGKMNLESTSYYDLAQTCDYDFFHTDVKNYQGIRPSLEIPEDPSFIEQNKNCNGKPFSERNTFTRGCIRVSVKKKMKE